MKKKQPAKINLCVLTLCKWIPSHATSRIARELVWPHSFARLVAMLRSYAWECFDLLDLLTFHGTASGPTE